MCNHITRRQFMKGSLALAGAACCTAALGALGRRVAYAQTAQGNGRIFVVIHLSGGNDWHQSFDIARTSSARHAYELSHPQIQVPANLVLPTADGYGLHPSLVAVHQMYQAGDVRIMRRVGTLDPSRSHDAEQLKFENGDTGADGLGWMGRVMDAAARDGSAISRFMTMAIGQGSPIDIQGAERRGLGVSNLSNYSLTAQNWQDQPYRQFMSEQVLNDLSTARPISKIAKDGQKAMYRSIETLRAAANAFQGRPVSGNPVRGQQYPSSSPGPQLRQIAMLMHAGLGTQLALCGMGGFDLHADAGAETGSQANLMRSLDFALAAFRNDMADRGMWGRTVVAIDSEFGRTVQQTASLGTDHGESIALVMLGGALRGGVSGRAVSGDEFLRNNNRPNWIPVQYHYANAYKETIKWLGLPTTDVFADHPRHDFNLF